MVTFLRNLLLLAATLQISTGFTPLLKPTSNNAVVFQRLLPSSPSALNAGFGGDAPKKKKEVKLKPKQQWDRYTKMKEKPFRVAVKAIEKSNDEWLEIGNVKSKGGEYTEVAVAKQRALIADVSVSSQEGCIVLFDRQEISMFIVFTLC